MSSTPKPTDEAARRFTDGWTKFMSVHNGCGGHGLYTSAYPEPDVNVLKTAYEKLLRAATFPNNNTANISLAGFDQPEINALLVYLDKTGVRSIMEWNNGSPSFTILDSNNEHLPNGPVYTMMNHKAQLQQPKQPAPPTSPTPVTEMATEVGPLYIPPFNVLTTDKGIYILLDHMHYQDVLLLQEALGAKEIPAKEKESASFGNVLVVSFAHIEEIGKMMKSARAKENADRAPENARIYRTPKGDPAINILEEYADKCIPLEGMMYTQIKSLEARLNQAQIPFISKDNPDFGPVFFVSEEFGEKLEALRVTLRHEHNARKDATMATPASASTPFGDKAPT